MKQIRYRETDQEAVEDRVKVSSLVDDEAHKGVSGHAYDDNHGEERRLNNVGHCYVLPIIAQMGKIRR